MKQPNVKIKKRVIKAKGDDKMHECMRKFKQGKLKDSAGNIVTDRKRAIAIALSESGLSEKSLYKAEIRNKLIIYKRQLEKMLYKEMINDKTIKAEILKLFRQPGELKDSDVHVLSERLGISPDIMETHIYSILRSFVSGGLSGGEKNDVDPGELAEGIKVEQEHTDDTDLAEKIARDHLTEDPEYYTKLKEIESN